ncbi:hypothetical protein K3495_g737 [Podosphaera aphanis]|nr:hypothetical protein K3495_g737 [Podosphaera aphanis]
MHPRIGIEPQTPRPPSMTNQQHKEFFRATEIASRFKSIFDQVTSLSKQSQDRYEENANIKKSDTPLNKVGDQVIVKTQNMQLGRPVSKLSSKWEGPFKVVKSSSHTVTLKSPQYFVSLLYNLFLLERFQGQKDEDLHANKRRRIHRTDNHEEVIEYRLDEIMDYVKADSGSWQYLINVTADSPKATCSPPT